MQNAGLDALGLNWRYLAFEVDPQDLAAAIAGARSMRFLGLNLTVPHKVLALNMVDALDESARRWGAVNTICFEGQGTAAEWRPLGEFSEVPARIRSKGFNTDADAIVRALQEDLGLKLAGAKVLLLGAGGAGRAAALKLAAEHVHTLYLVNRTERKAIELADEITRACPSARAVVGYPQGGVDLVLNATSLGLKADDPLPFAPDKFQVKDAGAVYDMVYRPAESPLLRAARGANVRAANGLGMLLYQGAKALELWTGQTAPLQVMREALQKTIYG